MSNHVDHMKLRAEMFDAKVMSESIKELKFEDCTMFVLCSECRKFLDVKDGYGVVGVSHGYCDKCFEEFKQGMKSEGKPQ